MVLKGDIPKAANFEHRRLVLGIESARDGLTTVKSGYVVGAHREKLKDLIVHSSGNLQPQSIRLLISVVALFRIDVWK